MAIIYHSNGKKAWDGNPNSPGSYLERNPVYHSNGKRAWCGQFGYSVLHWNGKLAWDGESGYVYHDNGKELTRGGTSCQVNWFFISHRPPHGRNKEPNWKWFFTHCFNH